MSERTRDAEILDTEEIFRGRVFRLVRQRMRTPAGRTVVHEIVEHPGAAVVVPFLAPDRVLLVRQYRPAVRSFLWEFPAGGIEAGETPAAAAARELLEETGHRAERWRALGEFFPAPGVTSELMHLFAAEGLMRAADPPGGDADEEIELGAFALDEVRDRVRSGEIRDGKTIVALARLLP